MLKHAKIIFPLMLSAVSFFSAAAPVKEGENYVKLEQPVKNAPRVTEFFSFFCPHCYQFEYVNNISGGVQNTLTDGVKVTKYHVDFLGGQFAPYISRAWAVAVTMGVEEKVKNPIFYGVQNSRTITNPRELRETFIKAAGITGDQYDAAWNSFAVKAFADKQRKAAEEFHIQGVPSVYVDGKYQIRPDKFDRSSLEIYIAQYSHAVNYLLSAKD